MFFLLIGRYCDLAMRRKTRAVAANLAALRAPMATRIDAGGEAVAVPATALAAGRHRAGRARASACPPTA